MLTERECTHYMFIIANWWQGIFRNGEKWISSPSQAHTPHSMTFQSKKEGACPPIDSGLKRSEEVEEILKDKSKLTDSVNICDASHGDVLFCACVECHLLVCRRCSLKHEPTNNQCTSYGENTMKSGFHYLLFQSFPMSLPVLIWQI